MKAFVTRDFAEHTRDFLARRPIEHNVLATVAATLESTDSTAPPLFAWVETGRSGEVAGAALRTPPRRLLLASSMSAEVAGDIDKSIAFYEKLGFEETGRMPIRDEAINVFMGLPGDGARLELTYNHGVDSYEMGTGYNHIAVTVDDLDGTLEGLAAEGIEPEKPPYSVRGRLTAVLRKRSRRVPNRSDREGVRQWPCPGPRLVWSGSKRSRTYRGRTRSLVAESGRESGDGGDDPGFVPERRVADHVGSWCRNGILGVSWVIAADHCFAPKPVVEPAAPGRTALAQEEE